MGGVFEALCIFETPSDLGGGHGARQGQGGDLLSPRPESVGRLSRLDHLEQLGAKFRIGRGRRRANCDGLVASRVVAEELAGTDRNVVQSSQNPELPRSLKKRRGRAVIAFGQQLKLDAKLIL